MRRLFPALFLAASVAVPASHGAVDFAKDVYPVLKRACFECHGPEQAKGGLRVHTAETLKTGGKSGPVIAATDPAHSELLRRVALPRTDKEAMPRRGVPLTPAEVATLRDWIAAGADWPASVENAKHWSYVPPQRPVPPAVKDKAWPANEVDHFILARLEAKGWTPSREADPAVLYRRLSLDLTGLPPSIAEVDAFVAAYRGEPAARQRVLEAAVDRLLASKDFGVRWARPWLDLARYADSHGFQRDDLREIWGYRDWVVDALNSGMPFDQFTVEQVAGDLLPNATPSQVIATGFHRCTPTNVEAGTEPEESRINQVIDRVNTTGAVWLGSTLECAQCHNHKYDPFSQKDYYSLLAYFNNTEKEAEREKAEVPGSIRFNGTPFAMGSNVHEAEVAKLMAQMKDVEARIAAYQKSGAKKPAAAAIAAAPKGRAQPLRPTAFNSNASTEYEIQPDHSVLLSGETPDRDTCTLEADLPSGQITGILIEALTDPSLPGDGPGRGDANRPNFVLQQVQAAFVPGAKDSARPLKFSEAYASFSQKTFPVEGLLEDDPQTAWAINPMFHKPHWAALAFEKPLQAGAGQKLSLKLVQHFGGGRVIGRLRVSAILGDVVASLPESYDDEPAVPVVKGKRKKAKQSADPVLAALTREKNALQRQIDAKKPATTEVMKEMAQPRMTAVFKRGVYTDPADPVTAATPAIFDSHAAGPPNRLTLAKWLASRDNPLTARVTVNRWWIELFGRGIVGTPEDFGIKGIPPTHPELLDWLAVEFMDNGWDMKALLKKIVTSAAYRQSSSIYAADGKVHAAAAQDPENLLLWHGPRQRMDAEMIRDNALRIAGLLDHKQGGPPIRPPQPDGMWTKVGGQNYKYEVSPGSEQYRRGLYVVLKRGAPYPSFVNFDASARMACVIRRSRSNTPLQALTLLNDPVYVDAAKAFVRRVTSEVPETDPNLRLGHAFRLALARNPRPAELQVLRTLFDTQKQAVSEDAAWYAVASAILNLDETITKG